MKNEGFDQRADEKRFYSCPFRDMCVGVRILGHDGVVYMLFGFFTRLIILVGSNFKATQGLIDSCCAASGKIDGCRLYPFNPGNEFLIWKFLTTFLALKYRP